VFFNTLIVKIEKAKEMKVTHIFLFVLAIVITTSCSEENTSTPATKAPATYTFERNGQSTVSFTGQTTRIKMAEELASAMKNFSVSEERLLEMFRNEKLSGGDADPFSDAELNNATKSIKSKTAASRDYFSSNATAASLIKADFESWMAKQVAEVFPNQNVAAAPGVAGQIADGTATRYVNGQGLEYDQMVVKSLIGALMTDQVLNHYLSTSVLDEAGNRADNDADVPASGQNYTTMEHKWDEAYGYLYGTSQDPADPNATIGTDDNFLNKYIGRMENDPDFNGVAADIFDAFKLGRAAIVEKDYNLRDEQAQIIREKISEMIAVRAVYYLEQGKFALENQQIGTAFHDLSEGYGFIYSLQFTRRPDSGQPYFTKAEVDAFLTDLLDDGPNGLWDVEPATLSGMAEEIAARFSFSVEEAGS
jgi:hypothetical protein